MKILATIATAAAALALAACSSGGSGTNSSAPHPSTSTTAIGTQASTSATPTNPIIGAIEAKQYPACKLTVGLPTDVVVDTANSSADQMVVHCFTGTSVSTDNTGGGVTPCDVLTANSTPVYYWGSQDPNALDQNMYAGRKGGNVVIVPNEKASTFFGVPGGLASVLLAVGNC